MPTNKYNDADRLTRNGFNASQFAIGGFKATGNKFAFIVPPIPSGARGVNIQDVALVSDTASTGSDGSNNFTFQVANLTQSNDLLSAVVTTNSNEIGADTVYKLTPDQNQDVNAGDVIELQIVMNGTATDLSSAMVMGTVYWEWV